MAPVKNWPIFQFFDPCSQVITPELGIDLPSISRVNCIQILVGKGLGSMPPCKVAKQKLLAD